MTERNTETQKKLYFFYFIVITIIVVVLGLISVSAYYYDFWSSTRLIKKYILRDSAVQGTTASPQRNPLDPVAGNPDAKVLVYEYSDFTCPRCASIQQDLNNIKSFYGQRIGVVFKGVPITRHPERTNALLAAYCAAEQDAFESYKDNLFNNQATLNETTYLSLAKSMNLDTAAFTDCYQSRKYQAVISKNVEDALRAEVTSTPTLFINGIKEDTSFTFTSLRTAIDSQLNK